MTIVVHSNGGKKGFTSVDDAYIKCNSTMYLAMKFPKNGSVALCLEINFHSGPWNSSLALLWLSVRLVQDLFGSEKHLLGSRGHHCHGSSQKAVSTAGLLEACIDFSNTMPW